MNSKGKTVVRRVLLISPSPGKEVIAIKKIKGVKKTNFRPVAH
jgi:hypothetical protein